MQTTHVFIKRERISGDGTDTSCFVFLNFSLYTNASSVTGQSWYVTQIDSGISIKFSVSVESVQLCVCMCVRAGGFGDNSAVNE